MIHVTAILRILIPLLGLLLQVANTEHRVELVQVLFRHGERTPREKELYPKDPNDLSIYEPWGLAQLTNLGRMREYRIGMMLRERYDEFLGDVYRAPEVYGVSTNIDRTKMSLQLVLAALYRPASIQTWNEKLPWMPIPTYYAPDKLDTILKPDLCPIYQKALENVRNTEEVRSKASVYKKFLPFLSEKTGKNITEISQVYEVYMLLTSQKSMNVTLPEWCTETVYKTMQTIMMLEYDIRSYTTNLKRLNGGMTIKRFIHNMDIDGIRNNTRKIYLYSAHETNIAAFAKAHNFPEPKIPAYGSAFIVEKLRDKTGELYVRILFWTGVTEELFTFQFDKCDQICPIDKYLKFMQDVIPSDKESNCLWDNITKEELRELYEERLNFD